VLATAVLGVLLACTGIAVAVLRAEWVAMREEAREQRITAAFRLFGPGKLEDYARALDELLEEGGMPLRVIGRRADLYLLQGRPDQALGLYLSNVEERSEDQADWIGYHGALGAS